MARAKRASKRKRRRMAFPALGAAGVSLAMAGGASATVPTANVPPRDTELRPVITLDEEEISDVSLATFYVFDKEDYRNISVRPRRTTCSRLQRLRLQRLQRLRSSRLQRLRLRRLPRLRSKRLRRLLVGRLRRLRL